MSRRNLSFLVGVLVALTGPIAMAQDAKALVEKAIKAQGGEQRLGKIKTLTWKSKGTISFGGNESEFTSETSAQGLSRYRSDFDGAFGKGHIAVSGDKGDTSFGGELDGERLAGQKREVYLTLLAFNPLVLRDEKSFKIEKGAEAKVGDKVATILKVTGPDGKSAKLYLDQDSGLPLKIAASMTGFENQEVQREWLLSGHKEFDGITVAAKTVINNDGEKFIEQTIQELRALDKVDDKLFDK